MTLNFDLESGAQCRTCRGVSPANFRDTTTVPCRFMGYCAWARVSDRGETSSLSAWNSLPDSIRTEPNSAVFGKHLKTHFSVQHLMFVNLLFIDFTQR